MFAILLTSALPVRLEAQCMLSGSPVSFEPNPPGVSRGGTPYLGPGFSSNLALYQPGGTGTYRLLMQESFGYSVLDLSNPANPTALFYHDVRFPIGGPNSVPGSGEAHSNVATIAVSPDGQRAAFSTTGVSTLNTVVGWPDGGSGFVLWGDFYPSRANSTLIQHIGSRYIAYDFGSIVTVSDITTLPFSSTLETLNMASETATWPGGTLASLAGNYILYQYGPPANTVIQIIDASSPGPIGSITAGFPQTTITNADFGGRRITYYTAAVDPADATKLWVLVELSAPAGENSPSYGLLYFTSNLTKVSAGPIWRVPSQAGETWTPSPGASSALVAGNGSLIVLMWAQRALPSLQYQLHSTRTAAWSSVNASEPPVKFDIPTALYSTFSPGQRMGAFANGSTLYAYLPTGASAYMIPMFCGSQVAPAAASMNVVDQTGAPLNSGDTVFLGDQVTITPSVSPSIIGQPLTGFGWNFDFDFHAGTASDDNVTSPRIRAPDNGAFGSPAAPPTRITVVGPCDYQVGGTDPSNGTGCWTSVTTNGAFGGPDFVVPPSTGFSKALTFAFEANNSLGSAGASLFTLNWKVPAAKLQSTQVLSGLSLASGSDGHPTGFFKWYFGASPTTLTQAGGCNTSTCLPTLDTNGTYYYWLTASYPNGYVTPDYAGTAAMGTYTVTDFAPAFAVNGATSGPITVVTNRNLNLSNSSQRGVAVTASGGYYYSLCLIPCSDNYVLWASMGDAPPSGTPPTTATIPLPPTAGNYALKIRVNHTGGTAYWPDPAGTSYFGLNVVSVQPLVVTASVSPSSASVGQTVTFSCSATGGLAPYFYEWRSPISFVVGTQQTWQTTSSIAENIVAYCIVTDSQAPTPASSSSSATATFTGSNPAVSVIVSASTNNATVGTTVYFTCSASGGGGGPFSYVWFDAVSGTGPNASQTFMSSGTYIAGCAATDFASGAFGLNSTTVTVSPVSPPPGSGPFSFFVLTPCRVVDTRNPPGLLGGPAIQPAGTADRAFAVTSFCEIPFDATAISVNVTATNVSNSGVVSIYRGGGQQTGTNTVALVAGRTRANNAILQLALDGSGTIRVQNTSLGTLDLVIDVNGYFR